MNESSEERDEFVQIYLEESNEEIDQLVKLLLQLEDDPDDVETLREAFRLLHTFKGSTGMMGYERVNALAHELETRFDACRSGRERLTSQAVSVVLRCVDYFREFLDHLADGEEAQGDPTALIKELAGLGAMPRNAGASERAEARGAQADSSESVTIGDIDEGAEPSTADAEEAQAAAAEVEETSEVPADSESDSSDAVTESADRKPEEASASAAEVKPAPEESKEATDDESSEDVGTETTGDVGGETTGDVGGETTGDKAAETGQTTADPEAAAKSTTSGRDREPPPSRQPPPPRSTQEPAPIAPAKVSAESGPVRETTVAVQLSDQIELPDLKARLIVARLQAAGDILHLDPAPDALDDASHPITLNVKMRTAADGRSLSESLDIDGVAKVTVSDSATAAKSQKPSGTPASGESEGDKKADAKPDAERAKPASTPSKSSSARRSGETIRVGIDRLDRLMNLAGELVVTNARFDQLADEMRLLFRSGGSIDAGSPLAESLIQAMEQFGSSENVDDENDDKEAVIEGVVRGDGALEEGAAVRRGWMERGRRVAGQVSETVDQLARLSRSIQQAVLETRMIPIGPMFNRFRRTVRDIAMKQDKQVVLELEGEMTELDKRMVDELGDPMIHLIRNALDHGIESTDERARIGKPREGKVRLRAFHQSNHVVIEIEDDGAGIDVARVRRRALERGLSTESELNSMTDAEIYAFIWHAGFSTAEQVSDISGRGVGMDVVRDRISALGGVVELTSRPGLGSTVSIRLPLTLSIVNAMIVRYRGFRLAIPVTDVLEIYGLSRSEIFESQGREMIDVRGRLLPLYRLDELFQWNDYLPPTKRRREGLVQAVLVRHGHRSLAIEVDDLDGNSDIVIKSLDEHFSHIPGLGGACVMGDGEVCLVLDTASLELKSSKRRGVGAESTTAAAQKS